MTDPLPEDQRLVEISSKAYEHPADRAATAALQSIPMLDQVVRKLIEYGYERALRQVFLGRLGASSAPTSCPTSGRPTAPRWRGWTSTEIPELYLTQFPVTNAAAIGSGAPDGGRQLAHGRGPRRARAAHGARPRGGAHPLRPRALPDGADDPAVGDRAGPHADARRTAAARGQAGAAGVVPRRRALRATARPRWSTATRS